MDRDELVEVWRRYGARFSVFSPFDQPRPMNWEPEIEEFDEKGRTNPIFLTHWKFLEKTKEFLRDRYREHKILDGPSLLFDCLVPKIQKRISQIMEDTEEYGPLFYDPHDRGSWYADAIRMDVSFGKGYDGRVGFSCRSTTCKRERCDMHRSNPQKRINPADIYGLLHVFEGVSMIKAKTIVGKWWDVTLGDLKSSGTKKGRLKRKVPKQAVYDLFKEYADLRSRDVKELIRKLRDLIRYSPEVEWHGRMFDDEYAFIWEGAAENLHKIKGPAVKAYVWLLIRQEESARNSRGEKMSISDLELSQGIGVSKRTAGTYREKLTKMGLVEIEELKGPTGAEKRITKAKTRISTVSPTYSRISRPRSQPQK